MNIGNNVKMEIQSYEPKTTSSNEHGLIIPPHEDDFVAIYSSFVALPYIEYENAKSRIIFGECND